MARKGLTLSWWTQSGRLRRAVRELVASSNLALYCTYIYIYVYQVPYTVAPFRDFTVFCPSDRPTGKSPRAHALSRRRRNPPRPTAPSRVSSFARCAVCIPGGIAAYRIIHTRTNTHTYIKWRTWRIILICKHLYIVRIYIQHAGNRTVD